MASPYGVPMPSGVPMPKGVPMMPAPSAAPPMPSASPMGGGGAPMGSPASLGPPAAPVAAAPPMSPSPMGAPAPPSVGQNGFGVHPDATHDHLADYLLPKFRDVESSGDYGNYIGKAHSKPQSPGMTASGAYGYTNSTWNNHGGYARAMDAPPEVQDARMRQDLTKSLARFGGDPFKTVANHYYPKYASDPTKWDDPPVDKYGKPIPGASSVRDYMSKVLPPDRVAKYMDAAKAPPTQLAQQNNEGDTGA
jgi:hypothetical protein